MTRSWKKTTWIVIGILAAGIVLAGVEVALIVTRPAPPTITNLQENINAALPEDKFNDRLDEALRELDALELK